jgi:hypothetical protein
MSRHISIWNKLSKKELVHVIEDTLVNDPLKAFKETRIAQLEMERKNNNIACWECRIIAKNLELNN